jgi:lipoyl(octanoyl) transferase
MKKFTEERHSQTPDEFWIVEHHPVFTQGQAGKPEHLLNPENIPVVQTDRGGQITYHGPGQLVIYTLLDIQRKNLAVRTFIKQLEQGIIDLLRDYHISASTQCGAPGVYVSEAKIASLGLRIKRGCSYHGLSLNIAMDLEPFQRINPCGYADLKVIQISDFCPSISLPEIIPRLVAHLARILGYTTVITADDPLSPFTEESDRRAGEGIINSQ